MQSFESFPYLTIPQEKVEVHAWEFPDGKSLGPWVEEWDPGRDLQISTIITLDPLEARSFCGMGKDAKLDLVATWRASGTTLRGRGGLIHIPATKKGQQEFRVTLEVPGHEISGRLELRTSIVLVDPGKGGKELSATHPGSILWIHQVMTDLEGGRPMFPICAVSFATVNGWSPDALWVLEWGPSSVDLFSQFSAEVRLYLNSDHPAFPAFSRTDRRGDQSDEGIRSALLHDLAADLINVAMDRAEEIDGDEFPSGTIGKVLSSLIDHTFDGMNATQVVERRKVHPGWFSTRLQASTNLFGSVRVS
jgi:hypothetical protein